MAGPLRRGPAAWTPAARLIAVLAVLAGLALLYAPRCVNGMLPTEMPAGMPAMASGATMAGAPSGLGAMAGHMSDMAEGTHHPATTAEPAVVSGRVNTGLDDDVLVPASGGMGGDLGGVLATCLAFLVVALAALVGLSPPRFRRLITPPAPPAALARRDTSRARPGGFARLCVLRI